MRRRTFLAAGCACSAMVAARAAYAQSWAAAARFARPGLATDEGGLWSMMDREETRLRRSPFALRDPELQDYVQGIACRLAGNHCPDLRIHLVRTPMFNASMAPNGMMQVWTGLLLRMENEAQLAAVIGHEIGHYVERHTLERLRDIKLRSAFSQFLGLFGWPGSVGRIAIVASALAFSRDQERAADRIGVTLMRDAGYDAGEAATVWGNLLLEINARSDDDIARESPLFATHPAPEERREALADFARAQPPGAAYAERWREKMKPHLLEWLMEEVKRGRHDQSLALLNRMIERSPSTAEAFFARGEILRMRSRGNDLDAALGDYQTAVTMGGEPPETHRGLGLIYHRRHEMTAARACFERYLELAPGAPDAMLIRSYTGGPGT